MYAIRSYYVFEFFIEDQLRTHQLLLRGFAGNQSSYNFV